ncbi:MAG TPA: hypothetical protein VMB50_21470 [Myxococcales bacterium]|nr:hypothetical protein [Myxococcales bacterium]
MRTLVAAVAVACFAACNSGPYIVGEGSSGTTGGTAGASSGGGASGSSTGTTGRSTSGTASGSTSGAASGSSSGSGSGTAGTSTSGGIAGSSSGSASSSSSSSGGAGTTGAATGGSTGGPFTPVSNAGCVPGVAQEYAGCTTNADCACPLSCQTDPVLMESTTATVCLSPCATDSDCPDPTSFCMDGVCRTRQCAFAAGGTGQLADGGDFWAPCDAAGTGDGICLPVGGGALDVIGICQLTGTLSLGAACSPLADRDAGPGALCAQGTECLDDESAQFQTNPPFTCQAACDWQSTTNSCATGDVCILSPIAGTEDGQLRFGGGEAFFGVCSAVGANGCDEAVQDFAKQWGPCTTDADCACDQRCLPDPLTQTPLCALPCTALSGCSDPSTTCQAGACWPNLCPADGGLAAPCNVAATGDGTCLGTDSLSEALDPGAGILEPSGECIQTGTAPAGSVCDPDFPDRATLGGICQAGLVCAGQPDGGGLCRPLCSKADTQAECASGQICELTYFDRGAADLVDLVDACFTQGTSGCAEGWALGGPGSSCSGNSDCTCPATCNFATGTCQ